MLHGGKKISLLTPIKLNINITITDDGKGYYYMISNGTGYSFLTEVFALGISLQKNEILYLPFEFSNMNSYETDFPNKEKHYSGLILINYCTTQIAAKDIICSIKTKTYQNESIAKTCEFSSEPINRWKTRHRTTVKAIGSFIIISTNADGFSSFAQSCSNLAEYGDDSKNNEFPPHMHHDWDENTSKSLGITLYYWQSPET
jgi:hypothetical protein